MDSQSRNGSKMMNNSTYQVSYPEGTTAANKVPMTASKSRLQQIKHITNNKSNSHCTNLIKSKFISLSPIGGPQKSFGIQ